MNKKQLETLKKNNEETRDFIRSCINFALMVLLKDKNIADISVSKLCQVAGVSRTAFYRNYRSVEEVLVDKIKTFSLEVAGQIGTDVYNNWLALFKTVDKYKEDFISIVERGYEYQIYNVFMSLLPTSEGNRNIQSVWLSLYYTFMVRWLKEGRPKKMEDAARLAYKYTKDIPLISLE